MAEESVRYFCRVGKHEDITDRVQKALGQETDPTARLAIAKSLSASPSSRSIVVTCSEGHRNVFTV